MNNETRKRRPSNTYPRSTTRGLKLARCPTRSSLPSRLYLEHSHCPVLAPATLAALPSTRAIPDRDVFYVADPISSIQLYARRTETLVAFTSAKTLSPGMRFISWTERVVMIDAISPMLVSTITSLVTLSDTMLFTFPGSWFRMLSSIRGEDSANRTRCQWSAVAHECRSRRQRLQRRCADNF
jgi:hypothetical protein